MGCGVTKEISVYLTSSIYYLRREVLVLVADDLAERVLNRGVIALDEVAVNELDGQTGFACGDAPRLSGHLETVCMLWHSKDSPTDLLPTMAILRCFGAGILLADCAGREVAERAARSAEVEVWGAVVDSHDADAYATLVLYQSHCS